jgi:hypothetical protein
MKNARVLVDGGERERGKKSGGKEGRGEKRKGTKVSVARKRSTRGAETTMSILAGGRSGESSLRTEKKTLPLPDSPLSFPSRPFLPLSLALVRGLRVDAGLGRPERGAVPEGEAGREGGGEEGGEEASTKG